MGVVVAPREWLNFALDVSGDGERPQPDDDVAEGVGRRMVLQQPRQRLDQPLPGIGAAWVPGGRGPPMPPETGRYDLAYMATSSIANRPRTRPTARSRVRRARSGARTGPAFKYGFEPKAFYTPFEVAQILRVSSQTILDWIHGDRLDAVQLSARVYRIPLGALMIKLGEPPRVRREIRPHLRNDPEAEEWALGREHGIDLDAR